MNLTSIATEISITVSENSTIFSYTKQASWIVPVIINIALLLATLWVWTSLLYYGIKTGKWKRSHHSNFDKLNAGLIYTSVVVVGTMCALYLVFTLIYMNVGFDLYHHELCDAIADLTTCSYALVLFTTMVFLWLRQRTFYAHSILQATYSKVLKIFSSASIIIIFISGLVAVILRTIPNDHLSSKNGCYYSPDQQLVAGYVVYFFATLFTGQLVLLGLFVYALKKTSSSILDHNNATSKIMANKLNKKQQSTENGNTAVTSTSNSNSNNKHSQLSPSTSNNTRASNERVKVILRKTFIFALLSVLFDTILQIVLYFGIDEERTVYALFVINAFLNLLFIVFSFVDYQSLIFSPCYLK